MRNRSQSTYRSSGLARTKVKKNKVVALFSNIFMQQRSEVGLVDDRCNSTFIIRIIIALLLLHLIIIGGIILHGKVEETQPTATATLVAPPAAAEVVQTTAPTPVPGPTANPVTHITQTPSTAAAVVPNETEIVAMPTVEPTPAVVEPTPAPVTTPAEVAHKTVQVTSGDNLRRIAERNNTTVDAILAINPEIKNPNVLVAGHKIRIPLPADSQEAKALAATREAERVEKEGLDYTVKSGDTLSKLKNKFGTSVAAIQKLNQMGNSTNLRVGQKIKIPATEKAKKALGK